MRTFKFLSVFIRFTKNKFEIVNRCHYEDEVRSNPLYLDCHAYARNDKFKIYNGDKNNFAILNLVKSFLTSITFDSLSRKIKNPCLVIKNLFKRRA